MSTSTVLRDACDACHGRKMRCPSEGVGACANCRRTGQVCQFSPRSEMGRPRLGSISSKRGHSHKTGKLSNAVNITAAPPTTSSSVETQKVTTLFQDRCRREARYVEEIDEIGQTDLNAYMETDLNRGVGTLDRGTSTLVATTSSWGDIPMAESSTAMPSLYMLDDSWMTSTLSPTAASIQVPDPTLPTGTGSASSAPRRPSFPSSSAAGGSPTNASATHSLLETYSQLSHILYALRKLPVCQLSDPEIPGNERQPPRQRALDQTFYLVSSLCDIITWLASGPAMPTGGSGLPCLLLVASVIASVMDIYRKTTQTYRELSRAQHHHGSYLFHPNHQPQKLGLLTPPSPTSLPPSGHLFPRDEGARIGGTHQHTLMLSDVTVMEFHLAQLQKALRDTQLAACDDAQTLMQLEHERGFLQGLIKEWQGG